MNAFLPLRVRVPAGWPRRAAGLAVLGLLLPVVAAEAEEFEAISSKVSNGYTRQRLPDGRFQPEDYAFGEGDNWDSARVDKSVEKLNFLRVARTIAGPLAAQAYLPTRNADTTKLLIMVYWGTTRAPEYSTHSTTLQKAQEDDRRQDQATQALHDAFLANNSPQGLKVACINLAAANADMQADIERMAVENQQREQIDMGTATLLGYDSMWVATETGHGGAREQRKADMLNELEEDRYFVVLMAYDFQALKHKKSKLLWETHISIREHANAFDERLLGMVAGAAGFFGRDSGGLKHLDLPAGRVQVGDVKSLGVVPSP